MSKILVTGGNGFIAAQILIIAVKKGYQVVATVRNEEKAEQTKKALLPHLGDQVSAISFAIVPKIDTDDAFDEVLKAHQFTAVLHTATPFYLNAKDPKELTGPAVGSTKSILKSINDLAPTVKRVVITSSFASIIDLTKGMRPGHVYNAKEWNPITWEETHTGPINAYYGAKKFAEKAAWDFVEEKKPAFELVVLCPPMVFGPVAQYVGSAEQLNTSSLDIYKFLTGDYQEVPGYSIPIWVSVLDIAKAHILAIEAPNAANKRFLIANDKTYSQKEIADILIKHYPEFAPKIPTKLLPGLDPETGVPVDGTFRGDNTPSKEELGMTYQSLEDAIVEFAESVKGFLKSS